MNNPCKVRSTPMIAITTGLIPPETSDTSLLLSSLIISISCLWINHRMTGKQLCEWWNNAADCPVNDLVRQSRFINCTACGQLRPFPICNKNCTFFVVDYAHYSNRGPGFCRNTLAKYLIPFDAGWQSKILLRTGRLATTLHGCFVDLNYRFATNK